MSANRRLLDRSLAAVWHPCTQMQHHLAADGLPLIPVQSGAGVWLTDFDGRRYLDGVSSWWVNLFGHRNPRINAALRDQLETLEHVILAGFTHEPVVQLSERLSALTGGALGHAFYASDGASATEIALKMSHHYWRNTGQPEKTDFLCLEGSYHGETAADMARRAAAALEAHLQAHHGHIAALIVEPLIQCATGMAMHDPLYLSLARQACDRYGVHLICDEIAVGFGRSGTFFAHEQAAVDGKTVRPDFLCLSKGITGGYLPLSVVLTTDTVYEAFLDDAVTRGFLHSHSYTGNALACRAALATLDIFEQDGVIAANRQLSERLHQLLEPLRQHPRVRHYRRRGMILAFDVEGADASFSRRFYKAGLERELMLRPIGNTVYLMPPYVLSEDEARHLCQGTLATLEATLA